MKMTKAYNRIADMKKTVLLHKIKIRKLERLGIGDATVELKARLKRLERKLSLV